MIDFMAKHPKVFYQGLKGFIKQKHPLDLYAKFVEYAVKTKISHHSPWKKVGSPTAGFPTEFLLAFDIFPAFPEVYAIYSCCAEASQPLIEHAESMGYSRDLCSYMKASIGAHEMDYPCDFGGAPLPDMYFSANIVCDTHVKWFENEARRHNIPHFGLDVPSFVSGSDDERLEEYVNYIVPQLYNLIEFLEKHTNKKFDEEKFMSIVTKALEISRLYREIYSYRKKLPAAQYFEFQRGFMLPGGIMWNLDGGIKYYNSVLKKIKKRYDDGNFEKTAKREKYRLMWEGITVWYKIELYNELAKKGARVVHEPYSEAVSFRRKKTYTLEETFRQMAREFVISEYTLNLEKRIKYFEKTIDEYQLDGVILHANLSCRPSSTSQQDLKQALQKSRNIPVLIFNSDMADPRSYAEGPISTRIDSFIEIMENNRLN